MSEYYTFFVYEGSSTGARVPSLPPDPNVPIPFNLNIKSDEEIVFNSNYRFNIDIIELLTNSKKCRRAKKKISPKPLNSFFIYMRNKISQPEYRNMQCKARVKEIGDLWEREPKEIKDLFEACARLAKKWYKDQREVNNEKNGTTYLSNSPVASLPSSSNYSSPLPKSSVTYSPSPLNIPFPSPNSPITSSSSFLELENPFPQYASNAQLDLTELSSNFLVPETFSPIPNCSSISSNSLEHLSVTSLYQYDNHDVNYNPLGAKSYKYFLLAIPVGYAETQKMY
jgi:hypothetical protein